VNRAESIKCCNDLTKTSVQLYCITASTAACIVTMADTICSYYPVLLQFPLSNIYH